MKERRAFDDALLRYIGRFLSFYTRTYVSAWQALSAGLTLLEEEGKGRATRGGVGHSIWISTSEHNTLHNSPMGP